MALHDTEQYRVLKNSIQTAPLIFHTQEYLFRSLHAFFCYLSGDKNMFRLYWGLSC